MVAIRYASLDRVDSFLSSGTSVCLEEQFLSNTTGFSESTTLRFVQDIIDSAETQFYAISDENVVGWCDILQKSQELHSHIGVLGMGVIKAFRGQGIGAQLIKQSFSHARDRGIEKVECEVYQSNERAQTFYKKIGFFPEGVRHKGKKHNGVYEDVILMGLFLS